VRTLITALDIFKLFSYTVTTTNCAGTLITALDIFKLKVPPQFALTVYEKSLKISKAVIKVPTQFVVVTVYEKIYSHNKLCGNPDYRFGYLQTLLIYSHNKLCANLDY
jgi:hypothetical protein